ncbi:STAS domain-containing protein [Alicyclobacillus fodiniaquatilis]|uniref:STAS domain-containing protein n=1 Tax=Alicyclobacillus fodiniaquatilis TaxID=1661150 RepID=A0ABW4JL70_9BACL
MSLSVKIKNRSADSIVIEMVGEVDFSTVDEVLVQIAQHRDQTISLDFSGVHFIDSTGIGLLLRSVMELREDGGNITVETIPPYIMEILDEMGISDILHGLNGG